MGGINASNELQFDQCCWWSFYQMNCWFQLSIYLLFINWLAILRQAVLRAEEDESARHYVEDKCEADPKGGQEDRCHRLNTPETVL